MIRKVRNYAKHKRLAFIALFLMSVIPFKSYANLTDRHAALIEMAKTASYMAYKIPSNSHYHLSTSVNGAVCKAYRLDIQNNHYAVAYRARCYAGNKESVPADIVAFRGSKNLDELSGQFISALTSTATGGSTFTNGFHTLDFNVKRWNTVRGFASYWGARFFSGGDTPFRNVILTGHSLGGALSHLAYSSIIARVRAQHAISFNSPRVFAKSNERDAYRTIQNPSSGSFLMEVRYDVIQSFPTHFKPFALPNNRRYEVPAQLVGRHHKLANYGDSDYEKASSLFSYNFRPLSWPL
ncbi:lipase family protein [Agarilytica rhodophyticola]|uniref:lipase family protein n=1 Tax=Agarilytica rhodophyticola TaxID=1737490 RepID=UPI000B345861|nr:hypothetical protein [Agarilytica rhodophyticola]